MEIINNNGSHLTDKINTDINEEMNFNPTIFSGYVPSNLLLSTLEDKIKPYLFHFLDSVLNS